MAEMGNVSVVHPRDPGSNLNMNRIFSCSASVPFGIQICRMLTFECTFLMCVYCPITLDPTRHVAKKREPQYVCALRPYQNVI